MLRNRTLPPLFLMRQHKCQVPYHNYLPNPLSFTTHFDGSNTGTMKHNVGKVFCFQVRLNCLIYLCGVF